MREPTWRDRAEYVLARGLERGAAVLPDAMARRLGEALGALVRSPLAIRRSTVRDNLRRAFPAADEAEIERLTRATFRHLGREVVAMIRLSRLAPERIVALTDIPRWDEVRTALEAGRGALLVTGHYGNWEVAAASVAARGFPISAVVKGQRNPLVDAQVEAARARLGIRTIDMGRASRLVPRALAAGHAIGIVADQDARQSGVWVPFFGTPASTFRGPALFALRFDVPVFAAVARRLPDGRYVVETERVPVERTGDLEADVVRLTAALAAHLEREIRAAPEQYFWFHKRWKTPPPAELQNHQTGTTGSTRGGADPNAHGPDGLSNSADIP